MNALIQTLNDAVSARDAPQMRRLLQDYRKLDPKDEDVMQWGYSVLADCLEQPGETSLTRARQFYDTQRASTLRRFVRWICFEKA